MNELRAVASSGGAYVSESNFFEPDFEHSYWGANHTRLAEIKKKYDPDGLFGNLPIFLIPRLLANLTLPNYGRIARHPPGITYARLHPY
jgi:Berberine and berberine like